MKGDRGGRPRRIVFWQPIVSPHQRDFLEAVAAVFDGEVTLAAERGLPPERVAQGWPAVSHDRVAVVDAADPATFHDLVSLGDPDTLHVFSGFFSHRIVWRAFRRLESSRARMAMLSEAPERRFPSGWLKNVRGTFLVGRHGGRFDFVMAMGSLGRRFMEDMGFPPAKIVTFGYRLPVPDRPWPPSPATTPGTVTFLAAGQLIRRKGMDVLLDACAMVPPGAWACEIVGDGPLRAALERRARRLSLTGSVRFSSTVPNTEMRRKLAAADWSVIPSRHDGWGMLVNESLIAGTPVICSDGCGAADLVTGAIAGRVVPAGDRAALAAVMQESVAGGKIDARRRSSVHAVALRHGVDELVVAFLGRVAGLR